MEEAEQSRYVTQLKAEFDGCDTTASGFLDREELTALGRKLQLDAQLPLLLRTLLGGRAYARVNFEEFKDGLVTVLSRSLDFCTSEDDSSYLEPVVPEEVKPKFVKGAKRYGRRSCPDRKPDATLTCAFEGGALSRDEAADPSSVSVHRDKLRRSTSLESIESLKSDEDAGSQKPDFQSEAPRQEEDEGLDDGGGGGHVSLNTEELDSLLRKLDAGLEGRVSVRDFQKFLRGSAPISCSTPVRATDLQRAPHRSQTLLEERSARSTSPSLLTATVGQRVLSRLDDGSGCTSPERVIVLWTEEGIRNSRDILQTLDFPLEERLSLADLTLALDNELLLSGNGIQQAALISYKNEIQHLQVMAEQACRERDKVRVDLDLADQRNLKLVREVDERHSSMETLNQSRIRDLELDFRDRLAVLRTQSEQESEALLQQVERERSVQQGELQLLRVQETQLQEELCSAAQENSRLEDELIVVKMKLTEAENSVNKLQRDMKQLLHDKMGGLDPAGAGLSHEERFREVVKEYELQFRELRDRNDELSSELELLKSQRSNRKSRRDDDDAALSWTEQHSVSTESDSDDSDMKRHSSPLEKKKIQLDDKSGLDSVSGPVVSIQTELALEQLKQKHNQELQQLHIQLDTQVNYYERSLELMRQSMEVERKDISQAFKLEISELEEHKARAEAQVKQLKEAVDKVQTPHGGGGGGGGWSSEQERRVQWERAELEQNFAREIGHLVQRLSAEKDELEAELKLKLDQEVMVVREESEQQLCQMKLQHAEGQRRLLHQLHRERQRLQEQRAFWEKRLEEEQATICGRFSSEKKCMKEEHEEAVRQLREEVLCLQEAVQNADLRIGQSEARLTEFRERCGQLEDDVDASGGRCSELEARLEEACTQLEDSITFLESHEVVSRRLAAEKCSVEEELQQARTREEQLLGQMTQLKEELGNVQAASASILQEQELVADNCSRLSNTFVQLQTQLRARDQAIATLRSELENLQDAMRTKATELDLLKTDRARLIQDLKEQAMAVDNLQLQLDGVSAELDRKRSFEQQLQEVLVKEQTRTSLLQSRLDEEKQEVCRLSQENSSYTLLADQLSTQIVEMEEEISTLRDHLRDLSLQLNETADLVLDLRRQLNSRTSKVDQLRAEVAESAGLLRHVKSSYERQSSNVQLEAKDGELVQVQQLLPALQDSQDQLRTSEDEFEEEKRKMRQQLMELEQLVLALEEVTESPHRTQLEELRSEKAALQERLSVLQQEVQNLEDDVAQKRRKLDEMEGEQERSREEEERLHRENSKYRKEVLDLSSRNLQLSARLHGDQEAARMLEERLATVSKEEEEGRATVRRLQEAATQQEREKLQQQTSWTQERHLLDKELNSCKDKLGGLSELEAELSAVTLKLHWSEEDKVKLLMDADDRSHKVEKLQQSLVTLESEAELLRSQLHAVSREKLGHAQEVTDLQRALEDARNKVEDLETSIRKLMMEKEELCRSLEEQACVALQEESHRQSVQKQELQHKLTELQLQSADVHKLTQEKQKLKNKVSELEMARMQAENQVEQLQVRLLEERRRSQQLEETLKLQAQQSSSQISVKQDQYEKAVASLQQRTEDLELKLKAVRSVLQEKVQEVKEQVCLQSGPHVIGTSKALGRLLASLCRLCRLQRAKNAKSSELLKDVYVENSQLMKLLQVTEQRQKTAEKNNFLLKEKVGALNRLLREIVPLSLAT
ncbi:ninein-like protein isoform X2 [Platichthys flesus]|uniref:ninein-like protein isoform X2 n=1 Tax=Platichthys flesus TaxID=8260 RepID=UPI002DB68D10|nr:ninein-like protein isoform X2 [Platichthys flesus]